MKKLTMTLTAAAFMLGTMAISASAQTQAPGAASIHAQLQNATPIIKKANCHGMTGRNGCAPGWTWACGRDPGSCRCVHC